MKNSAQNLRISSQKRLFKQSLILIIFLLVILLTGCIGKKEQTMQKIRLSQADNKFYPGETEELKKTIEDYLLKIPSKKSAGAVKAIIVPHAGYVFSGETAARAYKYLEGKSYNRVVIICNSHSAIFDGVAVDNSDVWRTPLGDVEVDKGFVNIIAQEKNININGDPFGTADQTLEVQLPFLQTVLKPGFEIVPIFFGNSKDNSYEDLAKALQNNLEENDLLVISTDMSHYPSYEDAEKIDKKTLEIINTGNIEELENYIEEIKQKNVSGEETLLCGVDGVKTVMKLKEELDWQSEILEYKNSGDSLYGDKVSVVGYGAMAFIDKNTDHLSTGSLRHPDTSVGISQDDRELSKEQKKILLNIAKDTIESFVKTGQVPSFSIKDERLNWKEGAFVTLHENNNLRGCIGQIIPSEDPLWQVVRDMAIAAATDDPRFSPVNESDLENLDYEVSVLSAPERIDNWKKVELGKHGVIVRKGPNSGVFLPQVATETGWQLEEFLSQLCFQKAGLTPDCYKNNKEVELYIFTAQVFEEKD